MSNRWQRKAEERKQGPVGNDPVSRQLATAVTDVRNAEMLQRLTGGREDANMQALLKPILETMAQQIVAQMQGGGKMPAQDETTAKLHQTLDRLTMAQVAKSLVGSDTQSLPVTEMAQVNKMAMDTFKDVAATERQRREDAESDVGGQIEYAVQRERDHQNFVLELFKTTNEREMAREREIAAIREQIVEAKHSQEFTQLQEMLRAALSAKEAENAALREKFAVERAQLEMSHETQLKLRDKDLEIEKIKASQPVAATPELLWQTHQINHAIAADNQELQHKKELHKATLATFEDIKQHVPKALDILGQAVGGTLSLGNPLKGAPPRPDDDAAAPGLAGAAGPSTPYHPEGAHV